MSQTTNQEKISKIKGLYKEFHSRMLVLMKKQSKLLEKSIKSADEKKLEEIRKNIKKK